jgi:uncharacterized protein (TIGR03067 family)
MGYWAWSGLRGVANQFTNLQARLDTVPRKDLPAGSAVPESQRTEPATSPDTGHQTGPGQPPADPVQGGGAPDRPARLEGVWRAWRIETSNGIDASSGDGMVIDGHDIEFLWGRNNKGATARFTTNPAQQPREIDIAFTSGSLIGRKQLGIYRISKGQLEVSCAGAGDTRRPTKFSGRLGPGAGQSYVVYRGSDFKEDEAVVEELRRLEGRWMADPKGDGVVIDGDRMQFLWGGNNKGAEARFLIDPSTDPREVEIVYTAGSERYHKRIGIYKLDGDTLTVSLSNFDAASRPTKFAQGPPGGGEVYVVYRRQQDQ